MKTIYFLSVLMISILIVANSFASNLLISIKSDSGQETLRLAIADAVDNDIITFNLVLGDETISNQGESASKTIVQADNTPNTASDRIFNITSGTVTSEDMIIRYGKSQSNNYAEDTAGGLFFDDDHTGSCTVGNNIITNNTDSLLLILTASRILIDEEVTYTPSDSPNPGSYSSNTYTEEGWTDIAVSENGLITEIEISYYWSTDSWPDEGSFHLESPVGTEVEIASNETSGIYSHTLTDFNGENLNGDWKLWIEDSYGDGGHQASYVSVKFYYILPQPTNPSPEDGARDVAVSGLLSCDFTEGTNTYDLWLGPTGNMSKVVDGAAAGASGSYSYSGLDYVSEYEWQVIEYHSDETINGAVWSFETEGYTISSYEYTSSEQSWTVPDGVTEIFVKAWGAGGASVPIFSTYSGGGSGGYAEGTFEVTPGQQLVIAVGGGGKHGVNDDYGGDGGWPGGGYGTFGGNNAIGGGGGGYSGVFLGSHTHSNALIIAGAGGGGGGLSNGGAGGGANGNTGGNSTNGSPGGYGGTQTAGGSGIYYGDDGSALQGGNGDQRGSQTNNGGSNYSGSGGGGGYYGGEGGQCCTGGGGGGSSYCNPDYVIGSGTLTTGNNGESGAGGAAPNASDIHYIAGVGSGSNEDDDAGNGLVVIKYSAPMSYISSTTETASTDDVYVNSSVNPIIRLTVLTSGSLDRISFTSVSFSTLGTTNVSDIEKAEVFYTTSTTFSSAIQFGAGLDNPSGTITFNGDQELLSDNNYFWLCYDISSGANPGNIIDGTCSSLTVEGNTYSPDIESPDGSRTIITNPFAGGSGTSDSPYKIATTAQLVYLSQNMAYWDKYFTQTIDLSFNEDETLVDWDGDGSPDGSGTDGFSPIGNTSTGFTGTYNGNSHTISNLYIHRNSQYQGLFGYTSNATIEKLGLVDASVDGYEYTGAFAGTASATTISECFANGSVTAFGKDYVGGLAGKSTSSTTISRCYSHISVWGYERVGGICGANWYGSTISKCYHTGSITALPGGSYIYGLAGSLTSTGPITDSYWDTETSGVDEQLLGGEGKTTREMIIEGTYSNWDFMEENTNGTDNIWGISPLYNDGYPFLAWQGYDQYADTPEGSGTEASPYQIYTLTHLFWLAQNSQYWDNYYEQSQNIDVSTAASWYDNAGFLPIGNINSGFAGYYDAQGHTISNLSIDRSSDNYIGLFGHTEGATIENLGLSNADISGNNYVGALAGKTASSTINYCYSEGTLEGSYIGGLIGINSVSEIKYCYNEATINAHSNAGGLIGQNGGTVKYCYNSGNVIGASQYIGGLIGYSNYSSNNCYNTGQVNGYDYVGGLTGYGGASYCYNTGLVVCSQSHKGGLTGGSFGSTTSCYYDKYTSGQSSDPGSSHGLTTMEMQMEYQYRAEYSYQDGWDFMGETLNGTDDIWGISPIANDGYPFLSWQEYEQYGTEPDGSDTEEDPYIVDDMADLYWISQKTERWDDHYAQSCDIDAAVTYNWCGGSGFLPIGSGDANYEFSGKYDGQGHVISNLKIIRENEFQVGFIGKTDASGQCIQNLGLPGAFIKGYKYVGGFVGNGDGDLSYCYISGSVIGVNDYVGGIVGYNDGADLTDCYSHANINGNNYVGGLIGYLSYQNVTNCYSKGAVTGNENTGGLIGSGANYVSNSFWDTETSGQESSAAGTGKTTAQMTTLSTYTNTGWDFIGETANGTDDYWDMDESGEVEDGYPFFGYQETPMDWTGAVSSDWNDPDNWSKSLGVPTQSKDITIDANRAHDPVIPIDGASINDLTVISVATLTIGDGGSLITYGDITNEGTINIEKSIADDAFWHFISAPTENATAGLFNGMYLQKWDEPSKEWRDITDPEESLNPAKGYSLWSPDGSRADFTFTGTPNTGDQDIAISYNSSAGSNDGTNLVGNPYPSYIDWDEVEGYGAKYTWNGVDYDEYTEEGTGNGSRYLNPAEGFFVVCNSGRTFSLDNDMRCHLPSSKTGSTKQLSHGIVLSAKGEKHCDALYLLFDEAASENFELPRDAWKLVSGASGICQIWSECTNGKLAVDVRPETKIIQLGFQNDENGNYSIGIKESEILSGIKLEDTKTGTIHDLNSTNYEFSWNVTDREKRFKLHFSALGIEDNILQQNEIQIYSSENTIYVKNLRSEKNVQMKISDITGRIVFEKPIHSSGFVAITTNLRSGIYIVSIINGNEIITKKIIIN